VSVSRYNADETDGGTLSSSRRSSQWCINSDRGAAAEEDELQKRSGSFSESMGDSMSLSNLSLHRAGHLLRKEDCIQLKVHGITEAGPSIKGDLVRVLQNKLDDAVLEVLHSLLSRNPACKLTSDDVHFIQKPHDSPSSILQFAVQPSALAYLPALAFYLRQNLLDGVLYTRKYFFISSIYIYICLYIYFLYVYIWSCVFFHPFCMQQPSTWITIPDTIFKTFLRIRRPLQTSTFTTDPKLLEIGGSLALRSLWWMGEEIQLTN